MTTLPSRALPPPIAFRTEHKELLRPLWELYLEQLRQFDGDLVYDATSFDKLVHAATASGGAPMQILGQPAAPPGAHWLGFLVARAKLGSRSLGAGGKLQGLIADCYVLPEGRRLGIASSLHARALEFFRAHGIVSVGLVVLAGNAAALRFWEALGYRDHLRELRLELGGA